MKNDAVQVFKTKEENQKLTWVLHYEKSKSLPKIREKNTIRIYKKNDKSTHTIISVFKNVFKK